MEVIKSRPQIQHCTVQHNTCEGDFTFQPNARSRVHAVQISLQEAVDRFKQEPGAPQNAYSWYRQYAARYGSVSFRNHRIPAVKQGRQWMVDENDFEGVLTTHREQRGHLEQMTADYNSRILHPGTVSVVGGGYTVSGDFHFRWDDIARARKQSDGFWRCNTCWDPATAEHNREECHRCRDWSPCGRNCTLSGIQCSKCGTSSAM